jgi:hypothetical protein
MKLAPTLDAAEAMAKRMDLQLIVDIDSIYGGRQLIEKLGVDVTQELLREIKPCKSE